MQALAGMHVDVIRKQKCILVGLLEKMKLPINFFSMVKCIVNNGMDTIT